MELPEKPKPVIYITYQIEATSSFSLNPHSPDDALSFGTDGAIQI
jgi:hypothetical protein